MPTQSCYPFSGVNKLEDDNTT